MKRRALLSILGAGGLTTWAGTHYAFVHGLWNPCLDDSMPAHLADHELVQAAWNDIDPTQVWDCHTHIAGTGDGGSGIVVNPDMYELSHPIAYLKRKFYLNAGCVDENGQVDRGFIDRVLYLHADLQPGTKLVLLALDYYHNDNGQIVKENSFFYVPNSYTQSLAQRYPDTFEWIASIHPYREDALDELIKVHAQGARAVKWLPPAQGIDPSSPRCDAFYERMAALGLPLLTHTGSEHAVSVPGGHEYGNPLLLRPAMDHGVRVIAAHSASIGENVDIDQGENGLLVRSFDLFARLMSDKNYQSLLFGEISALMQRNRHPDVVRALLEKQDWHDRLLNGSDYPLPAVLAIFSIQKFVRAGLLAENATEPLIELHQYNPLLFDFVLKRTVSADGNKFLPSVFHTRRILSTVA
ncbi:MAG: amidohydrolase family protein [Gammaproteobacteria bacterium]|nr:amidohydrolase family protein [Gammaproteobacteria bacterium]